MTLLSKLPKHLSKALFAAAVLASATNVVAATTTTVAKSKLVLQQSNISLALANQLVEATMEACHAEGKSAVVAVVDRAGNLIALQRDDNVGPHNTDAAIRKAYTALSTKTPSRTLADNARANPDSSNLNTVHDLLLIGGGVPIKFGGEVIGAIAGGGAGGAVQDESCALQGIEKVLPNQK
ncbi:heme-binding protein [Psychrobacter sp. TAE2020]|uniref:GlcG/HbpS family heme-binding protein n=1 Tax=Psychrobacter sp. TAE2020 TaxID=2846762 RepID=UPI001C0F9357|nr:heme-binding protein [Psychrobacter sp. TAE2020]MBU5617920.1 heme-binding protein [Psychrobacter sp. TAE2020]